jgi:hypothetical protein
MVMYVKNMLFMEFNRNLYRKERFLEDLPSENKKKIY